jgi:hypothetical protein
MGANVPRLDTLPITRDKTSQGASRKMLKRCRTESAINKLHRRKAAQMPNAIALVKLYEDRMDEQRAKRYKRCIHCRSRLEVSEGRAYNVAFACGVRCCKMCAAQRAFEQFKKYTPVLATFKSIVFITLTCETVTGANLKAAVRQRRGIIRMMVQAQKKRYQRGLSSFRYRGILKAEITIRPEDLYHPHIHLLLEGTLEDAERIVQDWIQRCTEAGLKVSREAQNIQLCTSVEQGLKELTKYVVKDAAGRENKITNHPADRQSVVWEAMEKTRALQPIGIKGVKDEDDCNEQVGTEVAQETPTGYYRWKSECKDWVSASGDCLMSRQAYLHPQKLPYLHPMPHSTRTPSKLTEIAHRGIILQRLPYLHPMHYSTRTPSNKQQTA